MNSTIALISTAAVLALSAQEIEAQTAAYHVGTEAALAASSTVTYPNGIWRDDFASGSGAPPLFYVPLRGTCAANNLVGDGGACINTTAGDNNSWKARFPTAKIDVREFGAVPDNSSAADGAVAAAIAYSSKVGACAYIPAIFPGYRLNGTISLSSAGSVCLVGDRIAGWGTGDASTLGSYTTLNFPNDSDGLTVAPPTQPGDFYVANLSLSGSAAKSASSAKTNGLLLKGAVEGKVENLFIQNFVICRHLTAPGGRVNIRDVICNDQGTYPNITNGYPYACSVMDGAAGHAIPATQDTGGVCRAAAFAGGRTFNGDGSTKNFNIAEPTGGIPLWRADGIKVRLGRPTALPNGQNVYDSPLQVCGIDYSIWDVSNGPTELFCARTQATLVAGNTTVVVPFTRGYRAGSDILAVADHGIPIATTVSSIADGTHLILSKAPYVSGTVTLYLTQIAIATGGPPLYSRACQERHHCGHRLEVRFGMAPPPGANNVTLQWSDPTGYVAFDAEEASDYLLIQPNLVGGYDMGLKHVGLTDGGIEFRPTYVELLNQCADIERQTYGDVVEIHRIVNDPIPNCPGYVDPSAGPTVVTFNNVRTDYNGASTGARTLLRFAPTDLSGGALSLTSSCRWHIAAGIVRLSCQITYPAQSDGHSAEISLPVAVPNLTFAQTSVAVLGSSGSIFIRPAKNSNYAVFETAAGAGVTNATLSGSTLDFILTYPAN
jgi:hypothetical protein